MSQEAPEWSTHQLIVYALQPANRCEVHTDLVECGDRFADDYRIDSETCQCMTDGWVFLGGMYYICRRAQSRSFMPSPLGPGNSRGLSRRDRRHLLHRVGIADIRAEDFIFKSQVLLQKNLMLHI